MDDERAERRERVAGRLREVLEDQFRGNRRLMAFCCDTSEWNLNAWLEGKRLPQSGKLLWLGVAIGVSSDWLEGRSDSRECGDKSIYRNWDTPYDCLSDYQKVSWLRHQMVMVHGRIADRNRANALAERRAPHGDGA